PARPSLAGPRFAKNPAPAAQQQRLREIARRTSDRTNPGECDPQPMCTSFVAQQWHKHRHFVARQQHSVNNRRARPWHAAPVPGETALFGPQAYPKMPVPMRWSRGDDTGVCPIARAASWSRPCPMSLAAADPALAPLPGVSAPRISWVPPPGGFAGLSILNGVLRILTLGVYHVWGKTEVRQRIWSAVRIDGEPLEYRGTGGELLRGFLVVFCLILLPISAVSLGASLLGPVAHTIYSFAFWTLLLLLYGIGIHRARRYRLSRTRWVGIRGGLSGRSRGFAWTYLWTMVLVPLTLGWILPWRAVSLQKALFVETRFGDNAFTFTGLAGPLYRRFWLVWVSAIVL